MKTTLRQIIKDLTRCADQNLSDSIHNQDHDAGAVAREQYRMLRILKKLLKMKEGD